MNTSGTGHRKGGEAASTSIGIAADQAKREKNIADGQPLCGRCGGTGNELYYMFRRCERCGGSGVDNEVTELGN